MQMGSWSEENAWDRIMADYQSRHEQAIEQRDEVLFKGHDLFKLPQRELRTIRPQMQYIFQDPYSALNPQMTIGRSIGEPLLEHRLATEGGRERQGRADTGDLRRSAGEGDGVGSGAQTGASLYERRPYAKAIVDGTATRFCVIAFHGGYMADGRQRRFRARNQPSRASGTAHRVTIHGIIMLMCGLDASSTAPAMVDPNEAAATRACGGHPRQSFGERARGHDVLDDQVAGSEQRGDAQAGQDLPRRRGSGNCPSPCGTPHSRR